MTAKVLYWIPRLLTIIFILFMTMFSLDAFEGNESLGAKLVGFFIHNIPVIILIIILIIAWKWEIAGGILFIVASIAGAIFYHAFRGNPGSIVVIGPFFFMGILFILHQIFYPVSRQE
jgi:hypothetical protein